MSDLNRFKKAHEQDYETALKEIRTGRKYSHWMWYIFPQIYSLGYSEISRYYAIKSLQEAQAYLKDPELGAHMHEICNVLLKLKTNDAHQVFGSPDDLKLCSSMTLFAEVNPDDPVFQKVLDKYYNGRKDQRTLEILAKEKR